MSFTISIGYPNKLCDLRPVYAFNFLEIVNEYDFWGYGNAEVLYSILRNFHKNKCKHPR